MKKVREYIVLGIVAVAVLTILASDVIIPIGTVIVAGMKTVSTYRH